MPVHTRGHTGFLHPGNELDVTHSSTPADFAWLSGVSRFLSLAPFIPLKGCPILHREGEPCRRNLAPAVPTSVHPTSLGGDGCVPAPFKCWRIRFAIQLQGCRYFRQRCALTFLPIGVRLMGAGGPSWFWLASECIFPRVGVCVPAATAPDPPGLVDGPGR